MSAEHLVKVLNQSVGADRTSTCGEDNTNNQKKHNLRVLPKMKLIKYIILALTCVVAAPQTALAFANEKPTVLVALAHPDDETWINGALARIAAREIDLHVVYVTSGDAGSDYSGQNLSGAELAAVREVESIAALSALGITNQPRFARLLDGKLHEDKALVTSTLLAIYEEVQPDVVITFGEDGVTGHSDHKEVGYAARRVADLTLKNEMVMNIAVSTERALALHEIVDANGMVGLKIVNEPSATDAIDVTIDVANYATERKAAVAGYITQFPEILRVTVWGEFVNETDYEELVVSRNYNRKLLKKLFGRKNYH